MTTVSRRIGFTIDEERAHTWTHLLGVLFIIVAGPVLLFLASIGSRMFISVVIYVITFLGVFAASARYHYAKDPAKKDFYRKIDHIAIYFFIAGSNTPYLLGFSGYSFAWIFLIVMWLLVLIGFLYKWFAMSWPDWISLIYYLLMGWLGVVTVYVIFDRIDPITFLLLLVGGIFYTIGTYFYRRDFIKWYHFIWHVLVLLAAITHYAALSYQLLLSS
ncbi:MAG: hypothetical protein HKN87_04860 [Saprospiraceae bacterium]|nr:hypothetical protein [Saprospiraceae bacterium]